MVRLRFTCNILDKKYSPSVGFDGVKLWDIKTNQPLVLPCGAQSTRGGVETLEWLQFDDGVEMLLSGTNAGNISLWRRADAVRMVVCYLTASH